MGTAATCGAPRETKGALSQAAVCVFRNMPNTSGTSATRSLCIVSTRWLQRRRHRRSKSATELKHLAKYDGTVASDRTRGELGARCDKEVANVLALNLAHEVIVRALGANDQCSGRR